MPIFRCNGTLCYFAHVPKCAGRSVERYLEDRFGSLAFLDTKYGNVGVKDRWTRCSPQHIGARSLARLFPADWFAASFAIVRDPYSRVVSAFNYQATKHHALPVGDTLSEWLDRSLKLAERNTFALDNHLRLQSDIVPEQAAIFRLENGFDPVIDWLDALEGRSSDVPGIGHDNATKDRHPPTETVSDKDLAKIANIFAKDFERFGYPTTPTRDYTTVKVDASLAPKKFVRRNKVTAEFQALKDRVIGRDRL